MSNTVKTYAGQSFEREFNLERLHDASAKGQFNRWVHKPLYAEMNSNLGKFRSMRGRGDAVKELIYTTPREIWRGIKNLMIIVEKVVNFVRVFFQTLFKEGGFTWQGLGERGKQLCSATIALLARPVTYVFDMAKLAAGVIAPGAAIHVPKMPNPDFSEN